jgi:tetratricopeptide (TPR) repeat protein
MKKPSVGKADARKKSPRSGFRLNAQEKKSVKGSERTKKRRRVLLGRNKGSTAKHRIVTTKSAVPARSRKLRTREPSVSRQSVARVDMPTQAKSVALRQYESAIKLMYSQDFGGAAAIFEKIIGAFPEDKEIQERVKTHLRHCEQKMTHKSSAPRTLEEHYDVGIALMNQGRYEESREHFLKALKLNPRCDFVIYAMAALTCRLGDFDGALAFLRNAVQLRPDNRFLAQHDSDFETLMQDVRFIAIVFPERVGTGTP